MTNFYDLSDAEQAERLTVLATAALEQWPGEYEQPELLKYRENAVFSVRRSDGERFALRVHRYDYHSDAALHSELSWMKQLGDLGVNVPPIIPAEDGRLFVSVSADSVPEARQVDMLGWLTGTPIGSAEHGLDVSGPAASELYREVGRLAARLHNETAAMVLPEGFTRHSWCDEGLLGDNPLWGRFWDLDLLTDDQRDLLDRARRRGLADLAAIGKSSDCFGLIHADFVPENLLKVNESLQLIDFDDAGFGWHMFELATALYFILDDPEYPQLRDALIEGYRSSRSLSEEQAATLPLFLFLRGTTYLGWVQTRSETETAKEMGPFFVERTCYLAKDYLAGA